MSINWRAFKYWDLVGLALSISIFLLWPQLDLVVAGNYYNGAEFSYANNPFVRFIYLVFAKIHIVYLLLLIAALVITSRKHWLLARRKALFLLLALVIGPGVLVNLVLKDNGPGRPRPQHITEFGGDMTYTPAFRYSGECDRNCSFVSGHAAIGFYLLAVAWVRQRRVWLVYGVILGALVGFTRILQGGHFLSDVIFAGWVTYFTCKITAHYLKLPLSPPTPDTRS